MPRRGTPTIDSNADATRRWFLVRAAGVSVSGLAARRAPRSAFAGAPRADAQGAGPGSAPASPGDAVGENFRAPPWLALKGCEEDASCPVLPIGLDLVRPSPFGCGEPLHGTRGAPLPLCGMADATPATRHFLGVLAP